MTDDARQARLPSDAVGRRLAGRMSVTVAFFASCVASGLACGGTTGREGLPQASGGDPDAASTDATTPDSAPETGTGANAGDSGDFDATVPSDAVATDLDAASTFDVDLMYADRVLPDVMAAAETGGAEGGGPLWPDCPPFITLGLSGQVVGPGSLSAVAEVPTAYDDAGNVIRAPPGSPCATYPWLGSLAADVCAVGGPAPLAADGGCPQPNFPAGDAGCLSRGAAFSVAASVGILLPPCNWAVDAGSAATGPGAGQSRYSLCMNLYACMIRTGCAAHPILGTSDPFKNTSTCLCGTSDQMACITAPLGPCATEELAALEEPMTPVGVGDGLSHYEQSSPGGFPGWYGASLNQFMTAAGPLTGTNVNCLVPVDAGGD